MTQKIEIQELPLWKKLGAENVPLSFELELTARCNNNCRQCYINLPAGDRLAISKELSFSEIESIADQAAKMDAIWITLTGGEPLIRPDFEDVYMMLKKKGFLITLFTNACLVNDNHIKLFKKYPPRGIEVTVYGVTKLTYEEVTRVPGSYQSFMRGLDLMISNGVDVSLKAMALRSNLHELQVIKEFCAAKTKLPFRFDPFLHYRYDCDLLRNKEIQQERLSPEEIVVLEYSDSSRFEALKENCDTLFSTTPLTYEVCQACQDLVTCKEYESFNRLFRCGIGANEYNIAYDGQLRLCSTLNAPGLTFDLRKGSLNEGLNSLRANISTTKTESISILQTCKSCNITNLCSWCPATAYLETGDLEGAIPYFCAVAHARAEAIQKRTLDGDWKDNS